MRDLVGNPEDRFSHNEAHILKVLLLNYICTNTNFYFELGGNLSHITQIPQTMFVVPQANGCIT